MRRRQVGETDKHRKPRAGPRARGPRERHPRAYRHALRLGPQQGRRHARVRREGVPQREHGAGAGGRGGRGDGGDGGEDGAAL